MQSGRNDNFFDIGGHSLLLARIQTRLTETFGHAPAMVEMFHILPFRRWRVTSAGNGTAKAMSGVLTGQSAGKAPDCPRHGAGRKSPSLA